MFQQAYYFFKIWRYQWLSEDELRMMQTEKLRRLVKHAYESVPYYRRLFKENGLGPEDISGPEDLNRIPVTTKQMVKQAGKDMLSRKFSGSDLIEKMTGGSTGHPLKVYRSKRAQDISAAAKLRTFVSNGYNPFYKIAVAKYYAPRKKFFHHFGIHREFNVPFHAPIKEQVERIKQIGPEVFEAYPSRMEQIAKHMDKFALKLEDVKIIFTNSETLTDSRRKAIKNVFGLNPIDIYGSVEFPNIACECPFHEGLHINADLLILQIVPFRQDDIVEDDRHKLARVVITDFVNSAMPLIRYQLDDLVRLSDRRCSCGRTFPLIEEIVGRTNEFVILPSGELMTGLNAIGFLGDYPEINQYRGIQNRNGSLTVQIKLEPGHKVPEKKIRDEAQHICNGLDIYIEYVDEISKSPVGKLAEFQSELISAE